ncbi:Hypothetical protein AA314_02799 [Archangium gephyra]|uniref:Uncharacterized protein n=1 Tax=Archangium gephyra TaxID=48 RepID=A0AAC8Q4Z7_9BACT|nr:Hypothetical protein AA314_02799 [Archangium gephyra]
MDPHQDGARRAFGMGPEVEGQAVLRLRGGALGLGTHGAERGGLSRRGPGLGAHGRCPAQVSRGGCGVRNALEEDQIGREAPPHGTIIGDHLLPDDDRRRGVLHGALVTAPQRHGEHEQPRRSSHHAADANTHSPRQLKHFLQPKAGRRTPFARPCAGLG